MSEIGRHGDDHDGHHLGKKRVPSEEFDERWRGDDPGHHAAGPHTEEACEVASDAAAGSEDQDTVGREGTRDRDGLGDEDRNDVVPWCPEKQGEQPEVAERRRSTDGEIADLLDLDEVADCVTDGASHACTVPARGGDRACGSMGVPMETIPFSRPYRTPRELQYLDEVLASGVTQGDGAFTARASALLQSIVEAPHTLLTTSGTHGLELAFWLLDLEPGDEVIVPSFTFSSTAAAVVAVGAVPVFADLDPRTGNIAPEAVEALVGPRTRAVCVVHYGGVGARMAEIEAIAAAHGLAIIEDNAHGLGGRWQGRSLGTFGVAAAQSFHATKNVHCGEGGALVTRDASLADRAEIIREKGTNRRQFMRGQVDKYTWVDRGSSYLLSELGAAVLTSQLESFDEIQAKRSSIWQAYADELSTWATDHGWTTMHVPPGAEHPSHLFYLLAPDRDERNALLEELRGKGIVATFHYVPLDTSPAGVRYGRTPIACEQTAAFASRIVRLPLWAGMTDKHVERVVAGVKSSVRARTRA